MSEIIRVEHLKYVYNPGMPDETTALDDVSFSVEEGDFVGIIGSTGSGKSTLISHFNGLNRPTSGRILIDGKDMWEQGADLRAFRFQVGLVMQYPEYQLFEETCYKDIAFGPRNMGLDEAEIDRRVHEAADFVGLDEALLQRSPFELSGGQKRRVAVAGVAAVLALSLWRSGAITAMLGRSCDLKTILPSQTMSPPPQELTGKPMETRQEFYHKLSGVLENLLPGKTPDAGAIPTTPKQSVT